MTGRDLIRALAVALLACGPALATAAPAGAAVGGTGAEQAVEGTVDARIAGTGDERYLQVTLSASQGPERVDIDPASVRLAISPDGGGPPIPLTPQRQDQGTVGMQAAVLALDVSGSMDGARLDAAKRAAVQYIDRAPANARIGLVTFDDPARVEEPPTLDRDRLRRRIEALTVRGDTAMFDAVRRAAAIFPADATTRDIVVLSDGNDEDRKGEKVDVEDALAAAKKQRASLKGVAIDPEQRKDIDALVGRDKVTVVADQSDLERTLEDTFLTSAEGLGKVQTYRAEVPQSAADRSGTLVVQAVTQETRQPVRARTFVSLGRGAAAPTAAARPQVVRPPPYLAAITRPVLVTGLVTLFVALSAITAIVIGAVRNQEDDEGEVLRRMAIYTLAGREPRRTSVTEQATGLGNSAIARGAVGVVSRLASRRNAERALDDQLDAAGIPLRTAEWTVLHLGVALGTAALFTLIGAGRPAIVVLGLLLGLTLPWLFVMFRRGRRGAAFLEQLPDTLQMLAGSLRAGYSLPQAMDTVSRESRAPIQQEFNRALIEARLGMPPEDALDGIASRTGSKDFGWIVMAIRIQREVGGNLAELLTTVATTLRERQKLRRQVSALSAEGRLSGLILTALPVVFTVYLLLARPEYLDPLIRTPAGLLLLGLGVAMLAVGGVWMSRIVKVEV